MKKIFILLILTLYLLGCNNHEHQKTSKKEQVLSINFNDLKDRNNNSLDYTTFDSITFFNGKLFTGVAMEYYENGTIKKKYEFNKGLKNGQFFEYYESEEIKLKINFIHGKKNGEALSYYENGNINQ